MSSLYKLQVKTPRRCHFDPLMVQYGVFITLPVNHLLFFSSVSKLYCQVDRHPCKIMIFFAERWSYFGTPWSSWCAGKHNHCCAWSKSCTLCCEETPAGGRVDTVWAGRTWECRITNKLNSPPVLSPLLRPCFSQSCSLRAGGWMGAERHCGSL